MRGMRRDAALVMRAICSGGIFSLALVACAVGQQPAARLQASSQGPIVLSQIRHAHDPAIDPDVPLYTDVTLPGVTPDLRDGEGRRYALITLYNVDPPLEDLPSKEAGVDRGMDYRDPSNIYNT